MRWGLSLLALLALPLSAADQCLDAAARRNDAWAKSGPHAWLANVQHNEDVEIARTWCYLWESHGKDSLQKGVDFGRAFFTGDGWHPSVGGIVPGSGFAGGASLHLERATSALRFIGAVEARGSYNGFWVAGGRLDVRAANDSADNRQIHGVLEVRHYQLPQMTYFGLGNTAPVANDSLYGLQKTMASARVEFPLPGNFSLDLGVGGLQADPSSVAGASHPSIEQKFTAADTPALQSSTGYWIPSAGIRWKYPQAAMLWGYSTSLDATAQLYEEHSSRPYSFRRIDATWRNLYRARVRVKPPASRPGPPRNVSLGEISATFRLTESWAAAGNSVPFYLQPTIGGLDIDNNDVLRSYRDYRFRAPNVLTFQAEYTRPIRGPLGILGFYDVGKVAMSRGDLDFSHTHHSFGVGIVVNAGGLPVLKVYYAWGGREGSHTTYTMNTNNFAGTSPTGLF